LTWWLIEAWRDKIQVYAAEWLFVRPLVQKLEEDTQTSGIEDEEDKENKDANSKKKKGRKKAGDNGADREAKVSEIFHVSMAAWCG
jgi:hypothetical protein